MNRHMCPCHLWKWQVSERCWKQKSTDLRGIAVGYCRRCGARLNDDGTCGLRARDLDIAFHGHKRALEIAANGIAGKGCPHDLGWIEYWLEQAAQQLAAEADAAKSEGDVENV